MGYKILHIGLIERWHPAEQRRQHDTLSQNSLRQSGKSQTISRVLQVSWRSTEEAYLHSEGERLQAPVYPESSLGSDGRCVPAVLLFVKVPTDVIRI